MKKLILTLIVTIFTLAVLIVSNAIITPTVHAASFNSTTVQTTHISQKPARAEEWCGWWGCPSSELYFICGGLESATVTGDNQWGAQVTWRSGSLNASDAFMTTNWWWQNDSWVTVHWSTWQGSGTSYAYITPYNRQYYSIWSC